MCALNPLNYTKTSLVPERSLRRNKERCRTAVGLSLVGTRFVRANKKARKEEGGGASEQQQGQARRRRRGDPADNPFISAEASVADDEGLESDGYDDDDDPLYNHRARRGAEDDQEDNYDGLSVAEEDYRDEEDEAEEEGKLELLYSLTERPKETCKIRNLLQISAGILGHSKVLFFDKLHWILEVADPDKCEIMYCGKYNTRNL